jgi:uncharacterized protein
MTVIRATLQEFVDALPVFDTHEHLRPLAQLRDTINTTVLLRESYLQRCVRAADGSAHGVGPALEIPLDQDSWDTVSSVLARTRFTSYYHWLIKGLLALYDGLSGSLDLTRRDWEYLSAELPRRYADGESWLAEVLDRANITAVIWDPFWKAGTWDVPNTRFRPSLRINSSLVAFHPSASDFENSNLIRDWSSYFELEVGSLKDLEKLMDLVLEANLRAGCRSLKAAIAYDRTLEVGAPTPSYAGRMFGTPEECLTDRERLAFGDYVVHAWLRRAREHRLVFQVHTGIGRLSGSNPLLLEPLLQHYPDVVFDIFHGGYPWVHHVGALAHNYPNVRLNLTWLPQISTEVAVAALKEWLQVVPQVDRISWGADCSLVEEAYGSLLAARHTVARALSELVEDGFFDLSSAKRAARSILSGAGTAIFGPDPERLSTPTAER